MRLPLIFGGPYAAGYFYIGNGNCTAYTNISSCPGCSYIVRPVVTLSPDANISEIIDFPAEEVTYNGVTLKIGDKVNYDEGTGYTSEIDSNFTTEDLDWRVLGVNDNGQLELISTKPTTSKLTLSGEEGYLNAETNIDTLCNNLYGNGEGAESARGLKIDDIYKLGNYDPATSERNKLGYKYGDKFQYRYSTETGCIQYRQSTDGGTTWTDWNNIGTNNLINTNNQTFKEPGKEEISSINTTDVADLTNTLSQCNIYDQIKTTTRDGISMSSLLLNGLNYADNNKVTQYLSTSIDCDSYGAYFKMQALSNTSTEGKSVFYLFHSWGDSFSSSSPVRPVVTLKSDVQLTYANLDRVWELN